MKIGDRVRIVGIPENLPKNPEFRTREVFQRCLGCVFPIADVRDVEGMDRPMIGLDVGELTGKESYMETIYIEPN